MDRPPTSVLDKLWSRLTDGLEDEVWQRLLESGNLGPREDLSEAEKTLILLCVREMNSTRFFHQEELGLLMGVDKKTVNARILEWNGTFYLVSAKAGKS